MVDFPALFRDSFTRMFKNDGSRQSSTQGAMGRFSSRFSTRRSPLLQLVRRKQHRDSGLMVETPSLAELTTGPYRSPESRAKKVAKRQRTNGRSSVSTEGTKRFIAYREIR